MVETSDGTFLLFRGLISDPDSINICVKISQIIPQHLCSKKLAIECTSLSKSLTSLSL